MKVESTSVGERGLIGFSLQVTDFADEKSLVPPQELASAARIEPNLLFHLPPVMPGRLTRRGLRRMSSSTLFTMPSRIKVFVCRFPLAGHQHHDSGFDIFA